MIKQFRIAFGLKPGSSILTFRARHVPNAPEGCLEARWRDWPLTILLTNFSRICQKMPKYFFEIDVGGVRMDSYGSVWTRMGPYGPWGLPGGFLGCPGALGGPERGVKGVSPPGGQNPYTPFFRPPRAPGCPSNPPGSPQGLYGPTRVHTDP